MFRNLALLERASTEVRASSMKGPGCVDKRRPLLSFLGL